MNNPESQTQDPPPPPIQDQQKDSAVLTTQINPMLYEQTNITMTITDPPIPPIPQQQQQPPIQSFKLLSSSNVVVPNPDKVQIPLTDQPPDPNAPHANPALWTEDIETVLSNIQKNCTLFYEAHRERYLELKSSLNYFRIPMIIISAINSVFSVGLQPYLEQNAISGINCLLSLLCGLLGSIELYLAIESQMESENYISIQYYLLSIDICKVLSLKPENRQVDAFAFMYQKYATYIKLIENSYIVNKKIHDHLSNVSIKKHHNKNNNKTATSLSSNPPYPYSIKHFSS